MDGNNYKFVDFELYCKTCKYKDICDETKGEEPCNECLTSPTNLESEKPIKYEEAPKK